MLSGFSCVPRPAAISVVILTLASPALARQAPVVTPSAEAQATTQTAATSAPGSTAPAATPKPTHYKRNGALIGLGAGMTLGFVGSGGCQNSGGCGQVVASSLMWGGIGAGIGAWIGSGLTPNQTSPGTPAFAQGVKKGDRLQVTTTDGRRLDGHFQTTSEGLLTDTGALVPSNRIAKVEKVTHRVAKGLAIGLITGVAVGGLTFAVSCDDECSVAGLLIPIAVGGGIGASFGALGNATHRRSDVIFDSTLHTTTFNVAPILSKTRKGVAFSMTWR